MKVKYIQTGFKLQIVVIFRTVAIFCTSLAYMQNLTGSEFDLQFGPVIDVRNVDVSYSRTGHSVTIHKTEETDILILAMLAILKYIMVSCNVIPAVGYMIRVY